MDSTYILYRAYIVDICYFVWYVDKISKSATDYNMNLFLEVYNAKHNKK